MDHLAIGSKGLIYGAGLSNPPARQAEYRPEDLSPAVVNTISTYNTAMTVIKRIPVSERVWEDTSELRRPGQTFDDLLSHMVEQEKKRRFIEDMDRIGTEGDFVELDFGVPDTG